MDEKIGPLLVEEIGTVLDEERWTACCQGSGKQCQIPGPRARTMFRELGV
jgi:hypothetical protein